MTDWNKISHFMGAVVPWPGSVKDLGYINLIPKMVDRDPAKPPRFTLGSPFRAVDGFLSRVQWHLTTENFKDQFYCLSLQAKTTPNRKNPAKPKGHRSAIDALAVKALWVDCDVGEKKQYKTQHEAMAAMLAFRARHNLPMFSAVVNSGGGLHFYWISQTALTVREWAPFADGLKALLVQDKIVDDAGVTTDVARILRVPGSLNFKTDPPKPVTLLDLPLKLYDFAVDLAVLPTLAPAVSNTGKVSATAKPPAEIFFDDNAKAAFAGAVNLGPAPDKGLGTTERPPLSAAPIFKQCEFYRDALFTGGADHSQPLWNLAVLGTTWMENGDEIAHAISKGHPGYSETDTQALYDRKVAERASSGLGWPSCASIASNGSTKCATCPLFGKGKSPLNVEPVVTATVTPQVTVHVAQSAAAVNDLKLPPGYDVDDKGRICKVVQPVINGEPGPIELLPLFHSIISFPWCQSDPDAIRFTTNRDKGSNWSASIKMEEMLPMMLDRAFLREKVKTFTDNKKYLESFMVSWLNHLHNLAAAQQSLPFGWHKDPTGKINGFAYGDRVFMDDGTEQPCGTSDPQLRKVWGPQGDIDPWWPAAKTITQQGRQELDCIIALAFSSPLTHLVNQKSMTLCAYGESGAGKSACYSVGIAVWGDPTRGKQVSGSTFNNVMKTMGQLNNLPMYWDEIKDEPAQKSVYDFIYNATDGVEKGRLKADTTTQERGTWSNSMMMATNISFVDYAIKKAPSHAAAASRVLEYYVAETPKNAPGKISPTEAADIIGRLETNFGRVGLLYAQMLAQNHVVIKKACRDMCQQVEDDMQVQQPERFWVALVGTLLVGADLANQLAHQCGQQPVFDVVAMKDFLYKTYLANRAKRDALIQKAGSRETTESLMAAFFAKIEAADTVIWTKGMPARGPGRPKDCEVVHGPQNTKNVQALTSVAARWDIESGTLYMDKNALITHLSETTGAYGTHLRNLEKIYGMKLEPRVSIGSGTIYDVGRSAVYVVKGIGYDHDWFNVMIKWANAADKEAAAAKPSTGFVPKDQHIDLGFVEPLAPKTEEVKPSEVKADNGLSAADIIRMAKGA